MNIVCLIGRWSRDIELKYTPQGTAVAKTSIAVDEGYGDKKETNFFEVIIWGKTAEAVANYSGKGMKVSVQGRLKMESWEKDGQRKFAVKVVAEKIEFLEGKKESNPFEKGSRPIDITDQDLPF